MRRAESSGAMRLSEPDVDVVPVFERVLDQFGWEAVIASREASDADVRRLVDRDSLGRMHFWHRLALSPRRPALDQLYEYESRDKEIEIFFYYGVPAGYGASPVLFATGSIASRIGDAFAYRGWPVLNRCAIAERYRNCGLYASILRHRFDQCRSRYRDDLFGIHVATAHAGVVRALQHDFEGSPFLYLGNQFMGAPANNAVAAAFAWLPRARRRQLLASPADREEAESAAWRRFEALTIKLLENRFADGDHGEWLARAAHVQRAVGRSPVDDPGRRELFALLAAIPVPAAPTPGLSIEAIEELSHRLAAEKGPS